jgi:hypothetical protein
MQKISHLKQLLKFLNKISNLVHSPESVPASREEVSHHRNAEAYLECHKTGPYRLKENDTRISDRSL